MRLGPLFRVLGTLLYGFIGYELGIALAGTTQITSSNALQIWGATGIGAVIGFFLSPWLVMAPAMAARNSLRSLPIGDLMSGDRKSVV